VIEIPPEALGPKMSALADDRRRVFCWLMASGIETPVAAARAAGYADKGSLENNRKGGIRVRAHLLMHDPRVLDAIQEATAVALQGLAPMAVRRAKEILDNPKHPAHARIIETVLDRTGHFARSEHTMRVEHSVDMRELEELARRLAAETGVSAAKFLGTNAGPVIEGEALEVEKGVAISDTPDGPDEE
jgi:hypothetical protein